MYTHPNSNQGIERQITIRQSSFKKSLSFKDKVSFSPTEPLKKSKTPWYMKFFICGVD